MNISQPVASAITGVDFNFLPAEDIRALSVKRIVNPVTFDSLLNPVPGGLYDPAFGAFMDNRCTTCNLDRFGCPGHPGHIELPVPIYHPTFMDQCLRLLNAKCVYCHFLKMPAVEVHRYACTLRLLRHGLVKEAAEIKSIQATITGANDSGDDSDNDSNSNKTERIMDARNKFVKIAIKRAAEADRESGWSTEKTEAVHEYRKATVKSFLLDITKVKTCGRCKGVSPGYRRDRFVKIFRKPLTPKQRTAMVQGGFKAENPLMILNKRAEMTKKKGKEAVSDEGVADMGESSNDEMDVDDDEESIPDQNGGLLAAEAATGSISKKPKDPEDAKQEYMSAGEVRAALSLLFEKEQDVLGLLYGPRSRARNVAPPSADIFFIHALLVPPTRFRPESKTGESEISENPRNNLYRSILQACELLNQIHKSIQTNEQLSGRRPRTIDDLNNAWINIQDAVNSLIDKERSQVQGQAAKSQPDGIKQVLEKKEGLFRMHMMGKRVNFAARSVISPDPNIETNEIGVPPVFAQRLTYPEPVTNHNFYELKEAVINGPDNWPGAVAVETETGQVINLRRKNAEERLAIANQLLAPSNMSVNGARNKKVHRHLNNGDVLIMNRQPTLHKPSMMVHRARVLPGEKTIRMHYANCNTYNADFDGDEMNMHFPQNETARAEAAMIADTDHQYLSGTAGAPLRGLIQDHISICVWLCNKDIFFTRDDYQQLLYAALRPEDNHTTSGTLLTIAPAILKPQPLWTGKQVVTTVLKNIKPETYPGLTLTAKSQTEAKRWGVGSEEGTVLFEDGEFITGILDKRQIGPKHGGFISAVYETYGHTVAGRLLSVMGRLLTKLLHMRAFSCGVEDLVLTAEGEKRRRQELSDADNIGLRVAAKYVSLSDKSPKSDDPELQRRLEAVLRDDSKQHGLDLMTNSQTKDLSSNITSACLPDGLVKPFPKNQMQTMTGSGAKGSNVNANLISCNLGQQVLEGRRVPIMVSGKSLPCFKPFEPSIRAGGYITDRFLTGIRPQEYFFHAMAGREGLIDTAVKTSRSGYLQRCLVKNMEGLKVEYDTSVRDSDGSIIQFLYGEDGLDISKSVYLNDFKFLANNFFSMYESLNAREDYPSVASEEASEHTKKAWKKVQKSGDMAAMDPGLAVYNPNRYCGSTSEKFFAAKRKYLDENPDKLLKKKKSDAVGKVLKKNFEVALELKYLKSIVEPGEAVGIVAGQSVGEPSTQMTLNTFHLAGHAAKNVTLGIPRLREIVMTASDKISTPAMTLHLKEGVSEATGNKLAKQISRLSLGEVVDKASVTEKVGKGIAHGDARMYKIRLEFFPADEYRKEYAIKIADVVSTLENRFVPQLSKLIKKELKKKRDEKSSKTATESDALPELGVSAGPVEQARPQAERRRNDDDDDDDDGASDEEDATASKARANRAEGEDYDEPDEEEEEIAERARKEASIDAESDEDEAYGSQEDSNSEGNDSDSAEANGASKKQKKKSNAEERESRVKTENTDVTSFKFDDKNGEWCEITYEYSVSAAKLLMLHLVENVCRSTTIRATPGITSCTYMMEEVKDEVTGKKKEVPVLATEGQNLLAMREHQDIIEPSKMFTNDIAAMYRLYGVEACRASIVQEMNAVFTGHGIDVDLRHLNLIADTMTRSGGFKPFNRMGLDSNVSPLMKMSFETTVGVLKDAVAQEDWDDLKNPSARIVMGRLGVTGTGSFDVLMPLKAGQS